MTTYPSPTRAQIIDALRKHGVKLVIEPLAASDWGRPWAAGLRAIVDHHTAGVNSLNYLRNVGGRYPYVNTLIDRDGTVHLLTHASVWGSGRGGPWPGIAARDSLHLVAWQNEVEDLGAGQSFTPAQLESLGKVNAALVGLGVPARNEVNHRDWTDGNEPVGGYPLPTVGRKPDTRYSGDFLRANTAKHALKPKPPAPTYSFRQGKKVYESKMRRGQQNSDSVWNLTLALRNRKYWAKAPIDDYTSEVVAAVKAFQRAQGWTGAGADGIAGPQTVKRLGLVWIDDK